MDTQFINENQQPHSNDNNDKKAFNLFITNWKYNIVLDEQAPNLYSRKAIYFFTSICSIFYGGTLMFINLRKMKNKQGQIVVAIYSILYGVITVSILSQFERNSLLTGLVSMLGSFPLYNFFWGKYIGKETEYRAKSVWKPLIIALVLLAFFAIIIISNIESIK